MARSARYLAIVLTLIAAGFGAQTVAASESGILLAQAAPEGQPAPTPEQRVAMLKQSLQASQAMLRDYEWIETTIVAKGGEEKSRKQASCYYGVEGNLIKVSAAGWTQVDSGGTRGPLRKKIGQRKKEGVQEYMKEAAALIEEYVPPDPNRIQSVVNSGNFSMNVVVPGQRVRLVFRSYLKAGDSLNVDVQLPTNRLLGMSVSSYLDDVKDAIQLDVLMGVLPDGTIFTEQSTLAAPAKDVTVTIKSAGHRPRSR